MCLPDPPHATLIYMDDREKELLATYRSEAASLFAANQAGRAAAERVATLLVSVVGITVAAGIGASTADVALPLPALVLLLHAYMFNQYSDLTVLGMARAQLEERVTILLGADALLYETVVAPIRKAPPLSRGTLLVQVCMAALVASTIAFGTTVAFDSQPAWVAVVYCVGTAMALAAAIVSYRAMLATPTVASREISKALAERQPHA